VFALAQALDEPGEPEEIDYSRVLSLDNDLRSIYRSIPTHYQIRGTYGPPSEYSLVGLRVCLGGVYHQSLCITHSKFLKSAIQNPQHIYSWLSCLDSAMTLLSFQAFQDQNSRFNGQLASLNRYQGSLTIHNFFLAATILCTALLLLKDKSKVKFPLCASLKPSKGDMFIALEKNIAIFDQDGAESLEARRASKLLSVSFDEIRHPLPDEHEKALLQPGVQWLHLCVLCKRTKAHQRTRPIHHKCIAMIAAPAR
jgi:hypothetical protein